MQNLDCKIINAHLISKKVNYYNYSLAKSPLSLSNHSLGPIDWEHKFSFPDHTPYIVQLRVSDPLNLKPSSHVTVATEPGWVLLVNAISPLATVVMLGHWITAGRELVE